MQVGLKERLIGAVVLVIIAAIVIPWVLKGNSSPGGATVSKPLALPAATAAAPTQTYLLPLNTSATSTAAVAEPSAAATARAPIAVPIPHPDTTKHKPQVQQTAPVPAAAPAPRAPALRQPQTSRAAPAGKWVVQAGSFDSERSALAVEHKLVAHGYHAYISRYRTKGNTLYRVRVGPFSSRDQAAHEVAGVSRAAGTKAAVMPNS